MLGGYEHQRTGFVDACSYPEIRSSLCHAWYIRMFREGEEEKNCCVHQGPEAYQLVKIRHIDGT